MSPDHVPEPVSQSHPQADRHDKAILTRGPRRKPIVYIGLLLGATLIGAALWFILAQPKSMVRSLLFVSAKDPYILNPKNDGTSFEVYQRAQKRILDELIRAAGTGNSKLLEVKQQIASAQLTDFTQELSRVRLRKLLVLGQIKVKTAGEKADKEGQGAISKLEEEAAIFAEQEKLIEQQLESLTRDDQFLNMHNLDLDSLREDLLRSESHWKKVAQEIDSWEIEQGAPSRITLLEEATVVGS